MPIEHTKGGTILTGDSIDYFRLCAMTSAVGLEVQGIRVTRGPVAWKRAARDYGLKGNKLAVYVQLCALRDKLQAQQEHISIENGRTVREVGGSEVQ